jgi:2-polyprenyl-3-methyl-5-hydroxy-6-metoxy-1,4-benzoquinol methylase
MLSSPQHQDVLDVGSGASALPAMIKECGYRITAIDQIDGESSQSFNYRLGLA